MASVKKAGVLRVGVASNPPLEVKDAKTGQWSGPIIAFERFAAKQWGVRLDITETTYAAIVAGVQAGKWDIATDIGYTPERGKALTYSTAINPNPGALMINTTKTKQTTLDTVATAGTTICLGPSQRYVGMLKGLKVKSKLLQMPTINTCLAAFQAGKVTGAFWNWITAGEYCNQHANVGIVLENAFNNGGGSYLGISKQFSTNDVKALDELISQFKSDPNGYVSAVRNSEMGKINPIKCAVGEVPAIFKKEASATWGGQ